MSKKTIIIFSVIIVILIAGVVGFWFYRDTIFSKEVLNLQILGPDTAHMGDEIEYTVTYKNNGNFVLQSPKLIFQLPDNSLTEDSQTRISQDLKDIYPGQEDFIKFKARLLGKEGDLKVTQVSLSYTPHNLSARYEGDTTFTTKIDTVPITLGFDLPSKIEKGKEITYALNYFSNIDYPLENMSIKIDAPSGFNFESADPSSLDNIEWKLPTLNKAEGGRINVKGTVTADAGNHIHFSAHLGMWQDGTFIIIKDVTQDVESIQSLLFISEQINGSSNYVASPGETLNYQIFLRNIGSTPFNGLFVISRIDGSAFDLSTLQSQDGQAKQNDNLIVFDSKQIPKLQNLDPRQEVSFGFSVKLKDTWDPSDSEKNSMVIKNKVDVSGLSQEFDTKVNSKLGISQSAALVDGSYQITWQVKNYVNDVKNVKVRAVLPQGVALNDFLSPESEAPHFSFDNKSREIVWFAGDISAGAGVANTPTTLMFAVSLQGGISYGPLVGQVTVSGEDQATGATIESIASALNAN